MEHGAVGADTLSEAKAAILGSKRGGTVDVPVIEAGASLAADSEGIFKSGRGDEGYARALALEESVGGDSGAVTDFDGARPGVFCDLLDGLENCALGIVRGGGQLEDVEASIDAIDAVSECAAGVDGDDEALGHLFANISVLGLWL